MNLDKYFEYWDEFFRIWKGSKNQNDYKSGFSLLQNEFNELPFDYPTGIFNCDLKLDETFEYIPEPYWGWTPELDSKLKFVVVNYNPASGGQQQHRSSSNIMKIGKYSDYVTEQIIAFLEYKKGHSLKKPSQYETTNWHSNNRAIKLAKLNTEFSLDIKSSIINYLGIDLVPWHTKNIMGLNRYFDTNLNSIQKWTLDFAIEAAKAAADEFKNIVIVRTNLSTFTKLFRNEFDKKVFSLGFSKKELYKRNNDNFQQVKIHGSEVTIILLWGMRNSLPTVEFMKQILIDINHANTN
jgi:hypothetical protein